MKEPPMLVSLDSIRFDTRVTPTARLFYAEICGGVTVESGFKIDDDFWGGQYGVCGRQVRKWRNELKTFGYTREYKDSLGFKYILPTAFDFEKQLNNYKIKKRVHVTYVAPDGRKLTNEEEAYKYFHTIINLSKIPESSKVNMRSFLNAFSSSLFDLDYYNKCFRDRSFSTSREFFQFVIQALRLEEIYLKADYIFKEQFLNIKQIKFYVVATLVSCFKDEFMSKARKKFLAHKRKLEKGIDEHQCVIDEQKKKAVFIDEQQKALKEKIMKELQKNLKSMA